MESSRLKIVRGLALLGFSLVTSLPLSAASFTWNGNAGDASVATGGNWVGNNPPPSGSDLLFGAETGNGAGFAQFDAGIIFNAPTVTFLAGAPSGFYLTGASGGSDFLNLTGPTGTTTLLNSSSFRMSTQNFTTNTATSQIWDGGANGLDIANIDLGNDHTLTFTGTGTGASTRNRVGVDILGTGTSGLTKAGTGTLLLSGTASYSGVTTVSAGTLLLGSSNRISNSSNLSLGGGTFATGGFDETVGKLALTNFSVIDFGTTNTSDLAFALSSDLSWGAFTINIQNFNAGQDTLRFGTNASALTPAQLSQILFNGTTPAQINSSGFVTPVPEPASGILLGASAVGLLGFRRRKAHVS